MPGIAASNRVILRDSFGRFAQDCYDAMGETIAEAVAEGAAASIALAPAGHKDDPRTSHLKDSISPVVVSRTQGYWQATARHALPIEFGAGAHLITGDVSFFWENMGRQWRPGTNMIHHPGNAAQPYLRPAYSMIMGRIMGIARGFYPG